MKNVKWIVAEDANTPTFQVLQLLKRIQNQLPNVYLLAPMPEVYRKTKDPHHLPKVQNQEKCFLKSVLEPLYAYTAALECTIPDFRGYRTGTKHWNGYLKTQ